MTTKQPALVRMKADTFRATLRLGLGFKGPVHVPESLKIRDTAIDRLCHTLCVDGDLDLEGCTRLSTLPERLIVRGKLTIDGCVAIAALPLTVREVVGLSAVGCASLGSVASIMECRGPVDLTGCTALEALPPTFRATKKFVLDGAVIRPDRVDVSYPIPDVLALALVSQPLRSAIAPSILARHPVLNALIKEVSAWPDGTGIRMHLDAGDLF